MAFIEKRGDFQYRVQVRRKGFPTQTSTFNTRNDAETWALTVESEMKRGIFVSRKEAESTTVSEALDRYAKEITPRKKSAARELDRIKRWQARPLAQCFLASVKGKDLAKFRDARRAEGAAENTIRLDFALLSHLFEVCRRDWSIEVDNPCKKVRLPAGSGSRERRLKEGEAEYLAKGFAITASHSPFCPALLAVAIDTGMRQGELLRLEWKDVDFKCRIAHLDDTKSGDPRDVPLSPEALVMLEHMTRPIGGGKVFPISQDRLIRAFRPACVKGRELWNEDHPNEPLPSGFLEKLKFHDLRHEAASRWAPHLGAQELAKMFGWKTIQMALRYYHPTGESIAEKLAKAVASGMVLGTGIEPVRPKAADFKSAMSTNSITRAPERIITSSVATE